MAARDFSDWVPIVVEDEVAQREIQPSAVAAQGRRFPMSTNTHEIPRLLDADVGGGSALTEDTNDGGKILLPSYQYNGKHTLDEAESEDAVAETAEAVTIEWLNSHNIAYDNASLGVTGARSATAGDFRPYTSIYAALRSADSGASYTANANHETGAATFANLSKVLGHVEGNKFFNPANMVCFAHPGLRDKVRTVVDGEGRLVFLEGTGETPDRLMGAPVFWTHGAITSTNFKMTVTGNRLVIFANRRYVVHGDRIVPQARFIPASANPDNLEHTVQQRSRKGFVLTVPQAASVLEVNA